jgi:hypothetical protein
MEQSVEIISREVGGNVSPQERGPEPGFLKKVFEAVKAVREGVDPYYLYAMGGKLPQVDYKKKQYCQYNEQIEAIVRENRRSEGMGIGIEEDNNWVCFIINGGYTSGDSLGKLYFNLKPEEIVNFLKSLLEKFREEGLPAQIKIPREGKAFTFNRRDKVVLYFDPDKAKEVLEAVEDLYDPEKFNDGGPLFAAEVKNKKGEVMKGVGFGEERITSNESFGEIRVRILNYLNYVMQKQGQVSSNYFGGLFTEACKLFGVDPQNPFLSLHQGDRKSPFEVIADRLQNSTLMENKRPLFPFIFNKKKKR